MREENKQFKCRILAGKVIVVDCPGYQSELFVAKIVDGRITLHNLGKKQCRRDAIKINEPNTENGSSSGIIFKQQTPLANSTPAKSRRSAKEIEPPEKRFPTPDIVRRAVGQHRNSPIYYPNADHRVKFVPLHRTPTPNTPKNLAKVSPFGRTNRSMCIRQIQVLRNLSNLSNFETPLSPDTTNNTANQSALTKYSGSPIVSPAKWRKCLTPQRTYIRRVVSRKTPIKSNKSNTSPSQLSTAAKVVPNYFINPTKYPAGDGKVIFQRRKLIIDKNLIISPKTFKKQLLCSKDLECVDDHLPKTRKQFIYSHQLAFDLLTNSSYHPRSANVLNSLFRRGCLNKKAGTILKYEKLTKAIPDLTE